MSSTMRCPQSPPLWSSRTTIRACWPSTALASMWRQSISPELLPVTDPTTCPSETSSTTVGPAGPERVRAPRDEEVDVVLGHGELRRHEGAHGGVALVGHDAGVEHLVTLVVGQASSWWRRSRRSPRWRSTAAGRCVTGSRVSKSVNTSPPGSPWVAPGTAGWRPPPMRKLRYRWSMVKLGRRQLALGAVEVDEAVDEPLAHVAGDGLLARQRTGRRLGAEGGAGRGPPGVPVLEPLQERPGGRLVGRGPVGRERRAVEVTDEVLRAGATGDPAGVEADEHDPLDVAPGRRRRPGGRGPGTPRRRRWRCAGRTPTAGSSA